MKSALKGDKLTGYTSYLMSAEELIKKKCLVKHAGEFYPDIFEEMMQVWAATEILTVTKEIQESKLPAETVWNEILQVDLIQMVKSHSMLITYQAFKRVCENTSISEPLWRQLLRCLKVFAANDLLNNTVALHTSGYFTREHQEILRTFYKSSLKDMRPHALNIIESYFHSDNVLNSCIGN